MRAILVLLVLAFPSAVGAVDAYLKGGWLFHVDGEGEIDGNDRWWVAGGADWHFASTGLIGFEILGAYRADVIGGKVTSRVVPIDLSSTFALSPDRGTSVPTSAAARASPRRWYGPTSRFSALLPTSPGNARSRTRRSRASRSTDGGWSKPFFGEPTPPPRAYR